ncbi:MAG: caspase family protein [Pirellulales bacterium]|nr:caspase family protein [Pirellulales bacterium]
MKRLNPKVLTAVLVMVLIGASSQALASKIYLLLAADTSAAGKIALSTGPDLGNMFDVFYANVPENQLAVYNFGENPAWSGPDISSDLFDLANKMLKAIDNCPAGPDDTVIFFYSGHGATEKRSGKHFLLMPDRRTSIARQTIIDRIKRKNPRLIVMITDSCSELIDRGMLPGPRLMIIPPQRIAPLFDELFLKSKGLADFNSSTEGQIAAGPVGGGLMVLAMAHKGKKPTFSRTKNKAASNASAFSENTPAPPGVKIPPVDFDMIIDQLVGGSSTGTSPAFDPSVPPYGFLWRNAQKRLSWSTFQKGITRRTDELFHEANPKGRTHKGKLQKTQTPQFYSIPKTKESNRDTQEEERIIKWSKPIYRPEANDRITEVNGNKINDLNDFIRAVKSSPELMVFKIIDHKSGRSFTLRTRLNPPSAESRLGILVVDDARPGIHVKHVRANQPGTRCQVAQ